MLVTLTLVAIVVLLLAAVLTVVLVLRLSRGRAGAAGQDADPLADDTGGASLTEAARTAREEMAATADRITRHARSLRGEEEAPVVALVGTPGAEASALARAAGATVPEWLAMPSAARSVALGVMTPFGAVLDFGDQLFTRSDWRPVWRSALAGLRRKRRARPLNGIVVAIRAEVLVNLAAREPERLGKLGETLSALLADAQAETGTVLPVYLAITAVDRAQGFAVLAELADRDDAGLPIVGWSVPHGPERPFDIRWLDQMTAELVQATDGVAVAALVADDVEDGGGGAGGGVHLLDMSGQVRALAEPLARVLTPMFRATVYGEPMPLRGVYLVGGADAAGEAAFGRALFERKVFPEAGLARESYARGSVRQRRTRWLRAATLVVAVLGLAGLAQVAISDHGQDDLAGLLDLLRTEMAAARPSAGAGEAAGVEPSLPVLTRATDRIFQELSLLTVDAIETPLVPTSYLSRLDDKLTRAMAMGLDNTVIQALRAGLEQQFELELVRARLLAEPGPDRLSEFAQNMVTFDERLAQFERLHQSSTVTELSILSDYALDLTPPTGFQRHFELYARALADTTIEPVNRTQLNQRFDRAFGGDSVNLFAGVYRNAALTQAIRDVSQHSRTLSGNARLPPADLEAILRDLVSATEQAMALLGSSRRNWLSANGGDFTRGLRAAADQMATLSFLDGNWHARVEAQLAAERTQTLDDLRALTGFGGEPVLDRVGSTITLDVRYRRLVDAVRPFLADGRLLDAGGPRLPASGAASARIAWQPEPIFEANEILGATGADTVSPDPGIPQVLWRRLIGSLRDSAEGQVLSLLQAARRPLADGLGLGGEAVRAEALAFADVEPGLSQLRDQAALLGLDRVVGVLDRTALIQAQRLLNEIDARLDQSGAYTANQAALARWDGAPGAAVRVFDAFSQEELQGTVLQWRRFIQDLHQRQARPVLAFLTGGAGTGDPATETLIAKWRNIGEDLAAFEAQLPENPLQQLEGFLTAGLAGLSLEACFARLDEVPSRQGFFGDRLDRITAGLRGRCDRLMERTVSTDRTALVRAFDLALAGRYPFVGIGGGAPLGDRQLTERAVDPAVLQGFFASQAPLIAEFATPPPEDGGPAALTLAARPSADPVRVFADRLAAVRDFLGASSETAVPGAVAFAVTPSFRTNRQDEVAADQIVGWSLEIGRDRIGNLDPPRALIWRQGDPVRLRLDWALNGPALPEASETTDGRVTGRTVTYSYGDPWALITLIARNTPTVSEIGGLIDKRPNPLRFDVPLSRNPDAALGGRFPDSGRATVFMRLDIRGVDPAGRGPQGPPLAVPLFPSGGPRS